MNHSNSLSNGNTACNNRRGGPTHELTALGRLRMHAVQSKPCHQCAAATNMLNVSRIDVAHSPQGCELMGLGHPCDCAGPKALAVAVAAAKELALLLLLLLLHTCRRCSLHAPAHVDRGPSLQHQRLPRRCRVKASRTCATPSTYCTQWWEADGIATSTQPTPLHCPNALTPFPPAVSRQLHPRRLCPPNKPLRLICTAILN